MSRAIVAAAPASRWTSIAMLGGPAVDIRSDAPRAADAGEDLPALGQVPVAEGGPDHARVGRPGASAQDPVLVAEEDLRVLGVGKGLEAGIGKEVRRGPLPGLADALEARAGGLPLLLARQALARPAGEGVGLVPGDVEDRAGRPDRGGSSPSRAPSASAARRRCPRGSGRTRRWRPAGGRSRRRPARRCGGRARCRRRSRTPAARRRSRARRPRPRPSRGRREAGSAPRPAGGS